MARTIDTLTHKRAEIERSIELYESKLAEARADLAAIITVCGMFADEEAEPEATLPYDLDQHFERKELLALCKAALARGPLTARELAECVMAEKGLGDVDDVIRNALCVRIGLEMGRQARRGVILDHGMRHHAHVWGLPQLAPADNRPFTDIDH